MKRGILTRVGRGKYLLGAKQSYIPEISSKLKILNHKIVKQFPFLDFCLWSSVLFNEFMLHQPGKFYLIVEVEKDATESVFYFLKEKKYPAFINPTQELLNKYSLDEKETWIVKTFVTEAPVQDVSGVQTTTIEKLLVDLFCENVLLSAQQGAERDRIFSEAFERYAINENRMLRYADRRSKKKEFSDYINSLFN